MLLYEPVNATVPATEKEVKTELKEMGRGKRNRFSSMYISTKTISQYICMQHVEQRRIYTMTSVRKL